MDAWIKIEPRGVEVYHFEVKTGMTWAEVYTEKLETWAREFEEFLRDHRSQDVNGLTVEREVKDYCSACNEELEKEYVGTTPYKNGHYVCANCGAELEI